MKELEVTLWDSSAERIIEIEKNLHRAASDENMTVRLTIMSEIPLLGRNRMLAHIPVLEVGNARWTLRPHTAFTVEECRALLHALASFPAAFPEKPSIG